MFLIDDMHLFFFSFVRLVDDAVDGRFIFTLPNGTRPFASRVREAVDGRGGRIVPAPRMMVILCGVWCKRVGQVVGFGMKSLGR